MPRLGFCLFLLISLFATLACELPLLVDARPTPIPDRIGTRLAESSATAAAPPEQTLPLALSPAAPPATVSAPVPQGGPTPACRVAVGSLFASVWPDPFIYSRLGCAVAKEYEGPSAVEGFERGWMFWRSSSDRVYVVYNKGRWDDYPRTPGDIFREGIDPEYTCGPAASPPSPRRGFSKIWCNNTEVRQGLGNAADREQGYCMDNACDTFQDFSGGLLYSSVRLHTVYVLFADGTWQKR